MKNTDYNPKSPLIWKKQTIHKKSEIVEENIIEEQVEVKEKLDTNFIPYNIGGQVINIQGTYVTVQGIEFSFIDYIKENLHDKKTLFFKLTASTILGIGTGVAMMPIFNNEVKELRDFGIDVHGNIVAFTISTINSLLISTASTTVSMFSIITDKTDPISQLSVLQKIGSYIGKVAAFCAPILPVALLWEIELRNQKVDGSHGFDKFIAWAAFTTIPLFLSNAIESIDQINDFARGEHQNIHLDSVGSKFAVYGITALSATGRFLAYTGAGYSLCKSIGFSDDISLGVGITAGGILGGSVMGVPQFLSIKGLFAPQEVAYTLADKINCIASIAEGAWFSLPLVSTGLNFTEGWNPLLKGLLFTPLFVSHTIAEATRLYTTAQKVYKLKSPIKEEILIEDSNINNEDITIPEDITSTLIGDDSITEIV